MSHLRTLIVEDEVLIADMIKRYLNERDYQVVGTAISYEEGKALYLQKKPDIVLLDIRLSGVKTGIDLAHFIQEQPDPQPFIFLTSQLDRNSLDQAKATFPAGYLSKPIQKETLYTTIEIAMHNFQTQEKEKTTIQLYNGKRYYLVPVEDILFLQADHIYVQVNLTDEKQFLQRSTLKETLEQLPEDQFVQTHRSFAVNIDQVTRWDSEYLYVQDNAIPISRSRRKRVLSLLKIG